MTTRWRMVMAAVAAACWSTGTQAQTVERDVAYVPDPHPEQFLDFTWPAGGASATVLFVHGGSLQESGERRSSEAYAGVCEPLVEAGIACATTDYRLFPTFSWPTMPLDVAAAVATVREHVTAHGGDPSRLFLMGHSSGCQIVADLGTNPTYLSSVGLAPHDLAGVVAMGCVLDNNDAQLRGLTAETVARALERDRSPDPIPDAEQWIAANPSYHVGPQAAPFRVVVAEAERFHPSVLEQGARFVRRLIEADVPADLVIVPGTHMRSIGNFGRPGDPTFEAVMDFIRDPSASANQ